MKQTATNEFKDGLNLDLHPIVTPNTVLTDSLNGTFITYNGNEFCLQNDRGNQKIISSVNEQNVEYVHLPEGYTPIGIKEHNGVLYIVSVNDNKTEIGTFPAPRYPITWNNTLYSEEYKGSFKDENGYVMYDALHVLDGHSPLTNIDLGYTIETPVTIEVQDSYDGSVNLILIADGCKPRIINSGFSVLPDDKYKFVNRKQDAATNIYSQLERESELIRTSNVLTNIDLLGVQSGGQWKGGNYTFYIKFGDGDFNQTDVIAESGIVSIFNGNDGVPSTISGTLLDERTDKMIQLKITGLNTAYSKLYIYFTREYSDVNGYRMTEAGMLVEPIDINPVNPGANVEDKDLYQNIWLTGFEQQVPIDIEELNVDYHTVDWARAEAQHSNMLFLGNVGQKETFDLYRRLANKSLEVTATYHLDSIIPVQTDYSTGQEYYSVRNIYSKVGYYPGEIYRFGIVYILADGSKTPVFNIPGWNFQELETGENNQVTYPQIGDGVCLMPKEDVITPSLIKPIYLTFEIPEITEPDVIGWFIVRQKRIPNVICEGLSIAVDEMSNTPIVFDGTNWVSQSFLASDRVVGFWSSGNPKLEYNNSSFVGSYSTNEGFEEWKEENNKRPVRFLIDLNDISDEYILDDNVDLGEGSIDSKIEVGINSIVQQYFEDNPDKANEYSDFRIYTYISDDETTNVDDEDYSREQQLYTLEHGGTVQLHWYRLYNEQDEPTTSVFVGMIGGLQSLKPTPYDNPVYVVNTVNYNTYLSSLWRTQYENTFSSRKLTRKFMREEFDESYWKESNALLSLDPCVNNSIASMLDGSNFNITLERPIEMSSDNIMFSATEVAKDLLFDPTPIVTKAVFIPSGTAVKVIDTFEYSTLAGNANDVKSFKYFSTPCGADATVSEDLVICSNSIIEQDEILNSTTATPEQKQEAQRLKDIALGRLEEIRQYFEENNEAFKTNENINLLRGLFSPFIGLGNKDAFDLGIYSIKHKSNFDSNDFLVRKQDNSEYYCVSNYVSIDRRNTNVFRGDCFTNTVTMRMIRNFIDPVAPVSEDILDADGWAEYVYNRDKNETADNKRIRYDLINLSDVNTVDLGYWVTFKCLSSYNLGLRSTDTFHVDEMSLLGSPRSFYPLNGASTATGNKMEESFLLNDGLSATVSRKRYNLLSKVPYTKSEFANRIMFSNVNITDTYTNGYRTFQGLSYKDYDKQYGAITKLLPLGQNLFVVMEHGVGLVPVNPKALMQTTTGEMIHIYGYGVLPDEITIVSQDYGSKYEHSVIRTPIGIYGIDVDARKVWRFSDKQGFQTISDMKVETYLKDWLENQKRVVKMGISDIRTHYNAKKGDLIFTWYDNRQLCSICFNERQNLWTTRYDWCPIVSENINDGFYSLNKKYNESEGNCYIWDHRFDVARLRTNVSSWYDKENNFEFEFVVSDPIGIGKIFDNLQIISNNVQPKELEITIIGDDYMFKRDGISFTNQDYEYVREEYPSHQSSTTSNIHDCENNKEYLNLGSGVEYKWDWRLHQNAICKTQQLKDIYEFGRRMGNIQYKNGMWFAQIEPLRINIEPLEVKIKEVRIRDKWAKIRIRYSGKDLAVITAIKTLINI